MLLNLDRCVSASGQDQFHLRLLAGHGPGGETVQRVPDFGHQGVAGHLAAFPSFSNSSARSPASPHTSMPR
jgi:hypothetical protein